MWWIKWDVENYEHEKENSHSVKTKTQQGISMYEADSGLTNQRLISKTVEIAEDREQHTFELQMN